MLVQIKVKESKESITNIISGGFLFACAVLLFANTRYEVIIPIASFVIMLLLILILLLLRLISHIFNRVVSFKKDTSIYKEVFRKAFHFVVLILILPKTYLYSVYQWGLCLLNSVSAPMSYEITIVNNFFLKDAIIIVSGGAVFSFIMLEFLRINCGIVLYPNILIRSIEEKSMAAHVYTALSVFTIALIFPEDVLIPAIVIPILQDAMAAIVGRSIGKTLLAKGRTLEGCLAGFITGSIIGFFSLGLIKAILIAMILEAMDFLSNALNINDNLLFPIIAAISIQALSAISMVI